MYGLQIPQNVKFFRAKNTGLEVGLYKVEFRILEIRISGETNLKTHFLPGNWIRKKSF